MWKRVVLGLLVTTWVLAPLSALAVGEGSPAAAAVMGTGAELKAGKAVLGEDVKKWIGFAAGIGIAIAAFGGALAQGRVVAAAVDGISRNPGATGKIFTPLILGLVLIESLVIYALVIAFQLSGKI